MRFDRREWSATSRRWRRLRKQLNQIESRLNGWTPVQVIVAGVVATGIVWGLLTMAILALWPPSISHDQMVQAVSQGVKEGLEDGPTLIDPEDLAIAIRSVLTDTSPSPHTHGSDNVLWLSLVGLGVLAILWLPPMVRQIHDAISGLQPDPERQRLEDRRWRMRFVVSVIALSVAVGGLLWEILNSDSFATATVEFASAPSEGFEFFKVEPTLHFDDSEALPKEGGAEVCKILAKLAMERSTSAIVVGAHDARELNEGSRLRFRSNQGLAQRRANNISAMMQGDKPLTWTEDEEEYTCQHPPVTTVMTMIAGPDSVDPVSDLEEDLQKDRVAIVYGMRMARRVPGLDGLQSHQLQTATEEQGGLVGGSGEDAATGGDEKRESRGDISTASHREDHRQQPSTR